MDILFFVGRLIFGGYFIMNGFNHFSKVTMLTHYAKSKHVPSSKEAVYLTGLMLLVGGISIVLGTNVQVGIWSLIVFLIPTTFMMHDFWNAKDEGAKMNETIAFMKNMALVGALLMLLGIQGPWSF